MNEYRFAELRSEPDRRVISGTVVRYGDTATLPWGKEVIESGAFDIRDDAILNVQHDRAKPLARNGGALILDDGPVSLSMRAQLPLTTLANDTLELIKAKVLRGLSVEFVPEDERYEGRTRIITKATLFGLSVVDAPAYPESLIFARERAQAAFVVSRRYLVL